MNNGSSWKTKHIILNFGAVDWKTDVWINNVKTGSHKGGYTPFSFDITPLFVPGREQKITVRVWDPADNGFQPRGKQVTQPGGIWYTSVTGIWQTVWLETDETLRSDIVVTKELGFNLIRKHVKVEPQRWYYHCDREGILVWQDMPSGDEGPEWQTDQYFNGKEAVRSPESDEEYRIELRSMIDFLKSNPCFVTWIPFNESWGQFKTVEIAQWIKSYDPTRLVNPASGGNFYPVGDILDIHHYPDPRMTLYECNRATILGEFGGLGLPIENHLWDKDRNWGYVKYKTADEVTQAYLDLAGKLKDLIIRGFSAAIYTQTTDVESEVNGMMTYDRKIIKMDTARISKVNREICNSLSGP